MISHVRALYGIFTIVVVVVSSACAATNDSPGGVGGSADEREMVVVLHGLGRSKVAMWYLATRLSDAGYRVERIGYRSMRDTPEQILADMDKQMAECCIDKSPKLHFVGHSLGGLLIRAHLAKHSYANLGRVVLLGTPNRGTEIVDNLRHKWWFQVLGPVARSLGTDAGSFPNTIGPPDYPLGVVAGKKTGLSNEALLPGDDDGLVSVESTRIAGMTDFVVVETGHSAMRYDAEVVAYVSRFLKTGRFKRD
jgi:pimeloyl-ACP methyl ester carboxylesterase